MLLLSPPAQGAPGAGTARFSFVVGAGAGRDRGRAGRRARRPRRRARSRVLADEPASRAPRPPVAAVRGCARGRRAVEGLVRRRALGGARLRARRDRRRCPGAVRFAAGFDAGALAAAPRQPRRHGGRASHSAGPRPGAGRLAPGATSPLRAGGRRWAATPRCSPGRACRAPGAGHRGPARGRGAARRGRRGARERAGRAVDHARRTASAAGGRCRAASGCARPADRILLNSEDSLQEDCMRKLGWVVGLAFAAAGGARLRRAVHDERRRGRRSTRAPRAPRARGRAAPRGRAPA